MTTLSPQAMLAYVQGLAERYEELASKEVAVGITDDTATESVYEAGKTVLEIGAIHEFGAGQNPKRSFIKNSNEVKADEIKEAIEKGLERVVDGASVETELAKIGVIVQNIYKDAFTSKGFGTWPDIKQSTKDAKGSSQVLIDTGTLRRSINHQVRER